MFCRERLCQHGCTSTAVDAHTGLRAQEPCVLPIPSHCAETTRPSLTVPTLLLTPWQGLPVQQAPTRAEPKKEVFKATKQASKSYDSQLASAEARFKAVTWKQAALYHPHGLPSPLTLHLLKGDSRTMSVPLCLCSIMLNTHSVSYFVSQFYTKGPLFYWSKCFGGLYYYVKSHISFVNSCICFIFLPLLSQHCLKIFANFVLENYTEVNFVFSSYCNMVEK